MLCELLYPLFRAKPPRPDRFTFLEARTTFPAGKREYNALGRPLFPPSHSDHQKRESKQITIVLKSANTHTETVINRSNKMRLDESCLNKVPSEQTKQAGRAQNKIKNKNNRLATAGLLGAKLSQQQQQQQHFQTKISSKLFTPTSWAVPSPLPRLCSATAANRTIKHSARHRWRNRRRTRSSDQAGEHQQRGC